jgi:O-antigen/teichoic acid export membrane protein
MCIAALVSVPFMLISYVAVPYVLVGYSGDVVHAAQLYLVYFLINALLGLPYQVLRVAEHFASWNLLRVLPALSWLLLLIVAWIAGRSDPVWLARSYLVVLALLVVPVAGTMLSLVHGRFVPERSIALPMLRYGLPSSLSAIPQLVTSRVDQIVIAATLTAESMGYYVVALACAGLASPLTSALSALVLPMVALHSDPVERIRVFAKSVRVGIFVAGVTGVVVAVAIPFVLPILFGQSFLPAMAAALVLVGAAALTAVNGVLEEGFRGLGHPEYVLRAHLAGAILGTALVIVLVREYAMIGAAVASLLAAATVAMALLLQGRFLLKLAMMDMVAPRFEELTGVARGMRAALARGLYALKGRVD